MSFRIAIARPHIHRQFVRPQKAPFVRSSASASQSRQTQPPIQAPESNTSTSTTPWIEHLRSHGDLHGIKFYGQLIRTTCTLACQNHESFDLRMQALVVISTMAAFLPFTSLVMLLDSSTRLMAGFRHPKRCQAIMCSGTLVVLSIFPTTLLITSALAGLIIIFEEELRAFPAHIHRRYGHVYTLAQSMGLEEKYTIWIEDLYAELAVNLTPDDKPAIPEPDIELGTSTFNVPPNPRPETSLQASDIPASTLPSQADNVDLHFSATLPSKFEPIIFPKISIQPHPTPPMTFDMEGWLIVPSPFAENEQARNTEPS